MLVQPQGGTLQTALTASAMGTAPVWRARMVRRLSVVLAYITPLGITVSSVPRVSLATQ